MLKRAVLFGVMVCLFLCAPAGLAIAAGNEMNPAPKPPPTGLVWGGGDATDPGTQGGIWGGGRKPGPNGLVWGGGNSAPAPPPPGPTGVIWQGYVPPPPGRLGWFGWLARLPR
jgi:hypothetical protein